MEKPAATMETAGSALDADLSRWFDSPAATELLDHDPADPLRVWIISGTPLPRVRSFLALLGRGTEHSAWNPNSRIFVSDTRPSALDALRRALRPAMLADPFGMDPSASKPFEMGPDDGGSDHGAAGLEEDSPTSDGCYPAVPRRIRAATILAAHDLLNSPPFSKLDFIYCPQSFSDFSPDQRQEIFGLLHFALQSEGRLLPAVGEEAPPRALFHAIEKYPGLYRRAAVAGPVLPARKYYPPIHPRDGHKGAHAAIARQALLAEYSPPLVLVDGAQEIVHAQALPARWQTASGDSRSPAAIEIHPRLRAALDRLCDRVRRRGKSARCELTDPTRKSVRLRLKARPAVAPDGTGDLTAVIFETVDFNTAMAETATLEIADSETADSETANFETANSATADSEPAACGTGTPRPSAASAGRAALPEAVVERLHDELRAARAELERIRDEHLRTTEELHVSNVEIRATYEELQVYNEELQLAQEKLSRRNEELRRVNQRLQANVADLERVNNDIVNLLQNIDVATLMLDEASQIQHFNPPAAALFGLAATDIGRPLRNLVWNFQDEGLLAECAAALDDLLPRRREVRTADGRWLLRRLAPYRTSDRRIAGVVVTCSDVTSLKEAGIKQALLATVLLDSADAVIVFDTRGLITTWNRSAEQVFGVREADMLQTPIERFLAPPAGAGAPAGGDGDRDLLESERRRAALEQIRRGARIESFETHQVRSDGREVLVLMTGSPVHDEAGRLSGFSLLVRDITRHRELEGAVLDVATAEQRRIGQELHDGVGQELTGLGLQAQSLAEALEGERHAEAKLAQKICRDVRRTLGQIRTLSKGLIPVAVDGRGVTTALAGLIQRLGEQSGCRFRWHCDAHLTIEDNTAATQLFRIAQEAITNALKHSGARNIDVSLRVRDRRKVLQVIDDGVGIDCSALGDGVGLNIMRYRAGLIHANLTVEAASPAGTRVTCVLFEKPRRDATAGGSRGATGR